VQCLDHKKSSIEEKRHVNIEGFRIRLRIPLQKFKIFSKSRIILRFIGLKASISVKSRRSKRIWGRCQFYIYIIIISILVILLLLYYIPLIWSYLVFSYRRYKFAVLSLISAISRLFSWYLYYSGLFFS
jgi:hypothetical protein